MIIANINARVSSKTHKFGIEVPTSIKQAKHIDLKNGNTLWCHGISKEKYNLSVAFKIMEGHESPPPGWAKSSKHWMFDVKMDFTQRAPIDPTSSSYDGVLIRESIRIFLTYAALHRIDVIAGDIRNAYIQAPKYEKHFIVCDADLHGIEHAGKRAMIVRGLYGGKLAGRDFWLHLRACMDELEFTSCIANPDVWIRRSKHGYGTAYCEYVLLYVDDCLVISDGAENVI